MIQGKVCPFTFFGQVYESTLLDTVYRIVSDLLNREKERGREREHLTQAKCPSFESTFSVQILSPPCGPYFLVFGPYSSLRKSY